MPGSPGVGRGRRGRTWRIVCLGWEDGEDGEDGWEDWRIGGCIDGCIDVGRIDVSMLVAFIIVWMHMVI